MVDLGPSEKSSGMTYVALSRVKRLGDLIVEPMTPEEVSHPPNCIRDQYYNVLQFTRSLALFGALERRSKIRKNRNFFLLSDVNAER